MSERRQRDESRRRRRDLEWVEVLERAFVVALGDPASPERAKPEVRVLAANEGGGRLEIDLRFRAGERYCCAEPACFLPLESRWWWGRLRVAIEEMTGRQPPPMSVLVRGVVEDGAMLEGLADFGLPVRSPGYMYEGGLSREQDAK